MIPMPAIPIHALFGEGMQPNLDADPRPALHGANLIVGVDVTTQDEFLVYGRDLLKRIIESGVAEEARCLKVALDVESKELEMLCALVRHIKGKVDYSGGTTD